jgi:hypothetical protein
MDNGLEVLKSPTPSSDRKTLSRNCHALATGNQLTGALLCAVFKNLVAGACNHPNWLVLAFPFELIKSAA